MSMKLLVAVLSATFSIASASPANGDAEALAKLQRFSTQPSLLVWSYADEPPAASQRVYTQSAVDDAGRFGVWVSKSPTGQDPVSIAYYDGKDLIYSPQAGIYSRTPTPSPTTRLSLTNWHLNPSPLLARIADDLADSADTVTSTVAGGTTTIESPKHGLTFRFEGANLAAVVVDRGDSATRVRSETVFSSFVGEGAGRHPSLATCTVTVSRDGADRATATSYRLERFSTDPTAVAAAIDPARFTAKADRRDLATGNVYSSDGDLKYNEDDRIKASLGLRPWYAQGKTWVTSVIVVSGLLLFWKLRALRAGRTG